MSAFREAQGAASLEVLFDATKATTSLTAN